jgi:hypothetical protein
MASKTRRTGTRCDGQAWCSVTTDLACWRDDNLAAGRTAVLERWRYNESAVGRMVVRACLPDDELAAGRRTMVPWHRWPSLAHRRDDESVAGQTTRLTRWHGDE